MLLESDKQYIWHPFTQMKTAPLPLPIIGAQGSYLYAENGKRYLDGISSWWVNLHGHGHPDLIEAIAAQARELDHVLFAGCTHPPAVNYAKALLPQLPGMMAKVFYSDNGSTAVETAIKIALQYWHNKGTPKKRIVCFRGGYHGDTFGAMSVAGKSLFNRPFWSHLFAVEQIDPPQTVDDATSLNQLQVIIEEGNVGAFIFEPLIFGTGGMVTYSAQGLDGLIACCKDNGILTIADEVMTGFGRTGTLFACEQLVNTPDILCLSKGITGGLLPLAVTVCTQEIFDEFFSERQDKALLHGHSYTANPIACACALASLQLLLKPESEQRRRRIAEQHAAFLHEVRGHPRLRRAEALGTLLIMEYSTKCPGYFNEDCDFLHAHCLAREILVRPLGNVLYVMPPYCIEKQELEHIYTSLKELL